MSFAMVFSKSFSPFTTTFNSFYNNDKKNPVVEVVEDYNASNNICRLCIALD